jgi:hypothetical protein
MSQAMLQIQLRQNAGAVIFTLTGDLDYFTSEHLSTLADVWIPKARKIAIW